MRFKLVVACTMMISGLGCGADQDPNPDPIQMRSTPKPRGQANSPALGPQIDRFGRAAINTALNNTFTADDVAAKSAKEAYNAAAPSAWGSYKGAFMASLAILDSLDTDCGNQLLANDADPNGRYSTLASVLVDDQLYLNTESGVCGTYLGLEAEVVGAVPAGAGGCGGRTLTDDVIERSYSVLAAGALAGIDDMIPSDGMNHSRDTFPFLANPNASVTN